MKRKKVGGIRKTAILAMFCAIAHICVFVLRIKVSFLTFDLKDAIITVCAMSFGPVSGVVVSLVVSLLEMLTVSETGILGALMNFISSAAFSASAGIIYNYAPGIKKTLKGAVLGLTCSVISMTAAMLVMNLLITPIYYGVGIEEVKKMMIPLLLPFNLIKSVMNAAVVLILYKPVSSMLKRIHATETTDTKYRFDKVTIIMMISGLVIIAVCSVIFILALGGEFQLFKK